MIDILPVGRINHQSHNLLPAIESGCVYLGRHLLKTSDLRGDKVVMQLMPFGCQEQKALAPVVNADFLVDIALVDKFTQNARQTLLGNPQYVQKISNAQPGIASDKMQYAVVRASETVFL